MKKDPKPVIISHPGCPAEPLRCYTCKHWKKDRKADLSPWCHNGYEDALEFEMHDCWACRYCGAEVE